MNTIEHLRHLFVYNDWANRRIIASIRTSKSEGSRRILTHLLITEREYFERLLGKDSTGFNFWPNLGIGQCSKLAAINAGEYKTMLDDLDEKGLGRMANYRSSEGIAYQNSFRELLSHVFIHSATHRGNIVLK